MSARPELWRLGTRLGVVPSFWDLTGALRETSDETCAELLAAMGHDASTEQAAARSHAALERAREAQRVEPVQVWRQHAGAAPALRVRTPEGERILHAAVELREEGGTVHRSELRVSSETSSRWLELPLPATPEPGYHAIELRLDLPDGEAVARQRLIVAPRSALRAHEVVGERGCFGLWANLYTLRSERNQGFGDFSDLRRLLEFCGRAGGDFVGVNPLHAIRNRGAAIAPYSPQSRRFRNPLYLDVEAIPELGESTDARMRMAEPGMRALLERIRKGHEIDHEAVLDWKLPLLADLHRCFAVGERDRATPRGAAYARYCAEQGEPLLRFATFCALQASLRRAAGGAAGHWEDWRRWPAELRDPTSSAVEDFQRKNPEDIDFWRWIQFELERQLRAAAEAGHRAGLRIGVYQDLAVGSAPDSADAWTEPALLVRGVTLGAPPDDYAPHGQDWGLPPFHPHRLREQAYRPWASLLRSAFCAAGALRIDHVMGLMRQFWIPEGRSGREGAYVLQPVHELLGVLALESRRQQALVIGEDLGTVPPELPPLLASWGVLSSAVLCFERDGERFRPASRYSPRALVTANTHDLPPLAGYFAGRDLQIRRRLGEIETDAALAERLAGRSRERTALEERLRQDGHLAQPLEEETWPSELAGAVNAFLASTPCPLVGVSLDDLCGETEPLNVPGFPVEAHRSWSRRMGLSLESLDESRPVQRALAGVQLRARPADGSKRPV